MWRGDTIQRFSTNGIAQGEYLPPFGGLAQAAVAEASPTGEVLLAGVQPGKTAAGVCTFTFPLVLWVAP